MGADCLIGQGRGAHFGTAQFRSHSDALPRPLRRLVAWIDDAPGSPAAAVEAVTDAAAALAIAFAVRALALSNFAARLAALSCSMRAALRASEVPAGADDVSRVRSAI